MRAASLCFLGCVVLLISSCSADESFSAELFHPFYEDLGLNESQTSISLEQFDHLVDEIFSKGQGGHDEHGDEHADDNHDDHRRQAVVDDHGHEEDEHHAEEAHCHSAEEIFEAYDADHDSMLSSDELLNASATLFLMVAEKCTVSHDDEGNSTDTTCTSKTTSEEAWGYSILAVVLVSIPSLLGIGLLPVSGSVAMTYVLEGALALGVGTLMGSILMHLLPLVLGIHNAQFLSAEEQEMLEQAGELDFLWPLCVTLVVMLLFFITERMIRDWQRNNAVWRSKLLQIEIFELLDDWAEYDDEHTEEQGNNRRALSPAELRPIAWVLVIADFLHNFADGLAIGASWVLNVRVGVATSLAVLCHELPQEIGDYAVLVQSGISRRTAVGLNVLVSLCSLLGAVISVAIGTNVALAQRWVLSVAMGGFFYVALGAMVPVLTRIQGPKHSLLQCITMAVGFVIMFLLAIFEFQIDCPTLLRQAV